MPSNPTKQTKRKNITYMTLDQAVYQRCTCVNKQKKIMWFNRKWVLWNNICRCSRSWVSWWQGRPEWEPVRALRWAMLPPVGRPPVGKVGDSEDQCESQFTISESSPLGATAFIMAASSWECWRQWNPEWVPACSQWERLARACGLYQASSWATLAEKQKKC